MIQLNRGFVIHPGLKVELTSHWAYSNDPEL